MLYRIGLKDERPTSNFQLPTSNKNKNINSNIQLRHGVVVFLEAVQQSLRFTPMTQASFQADQMSVGSSFPI
jgi:hypothetical protein